MEYKTKRISIMIGEHQHQEIVDAGLNISGFLRDLVDDHFSKSSITLSVTPETQKLYQKLIANTGATDKDLDPYLHKVFKEMIKDRIKELQKLEKEL